MNPIEASGVSRRYGDEVAVHPLDIDVRPGEIHALVGLNGAGKTTLMRMLTGMIAPDSGDVYLGGAPLDSATPATWSRVGHMIETPFGYPELTVAENIRAAARLRLVEDVERATAASIDRFELSHWETRKARALSMGNRQRLGLACALVNDPRIIVLDEPSNALDPAGVVLVRDLMRDDATRGASILVSSHHLDELARVAHRITVLHRGRVVGSLDPTGLDLERRFFEIVHDEDVKLTEEGSHA